MIKKYLEFLKESDESDDIQDTVETDNTDNTEDLAPDENKYGELKDEVKSMIEKTIENSGGEYKSFVESFIKNPEDVKIEGLINDSDIYDFYLKYRNDIDELLSDINYFDEVPSESNVAGLYDYIIKGAERAVKEVVKLF